MNKDFEWDEPTSSDTKMDPAEVLQLEREFQEHGGRGVDNLVKVLDGTNDTSIPETYNKTMPVISQSLIKELLYKGRLLSSEILSFIHKERCSKDP